MLSAAIFNAKKVSKLGSNFMLQLGWSLMIISGIYIVLVYLFELSIHDALKYLLIMASYLTKKQQYWVAIGEKQHQLEQT